MEWHGPRSARPAGEAPQPLKRVHALPRKGSHGRPSRVPRDHFVFADYGLVVGLRDLSLCRRLGETPVIIAGGTNDGLPFFLARNFSDFVGLYLRVPDAVGLRSRHKKGPEAAPATRLGPFAWQSQVPRQFGPAANRTGLVGRFGRGRGATRRESTTRVRLGLCRGRTVLGVDRAGRQTGVGDEHRESLRRERTRGW